MTNTAPTGAISTRPANLRNIKRVDYKSLAGLNIIEACIEEPKNVK